MTILGVDYASVDGNRAPNWAVLRDACKAAGNTLGFAFFRASYGTMQDPTARMQMKEAMDNGLTVGAYMFLRLHPSIRAKQPPRDQVAAFVESARATWKAPQKLFAPVLDIEDTASKDDAEELRLIDEAWQELKRIYGVPPINYTSRRVWNEELGGPRTSTWTDSPLWLAKPWPWQTRTKAQLDPVRAAGAVSLTPDVPAPWGDGNWWIHQYQGDALPVPGFSSTVDLNRFNVMSRSTGLVFGNRVSWVQRRLGKNETGVFSLETEAAIRDFQTANGLVADGIVGPKTFAALSWTTPPDAPTCASAA